MTSPGRTWLLPWKMYVLQLCKMLTSTTRNLMWLILFVSYQNFGKLTLVSTSRNLMLN